MDISWERADLLAFRLCCFILDLFCPFTVWCLGKEVEFDSIGSWSLPVHLLFITFEDQPAKNCINILFVQLRSLKRNTHIVFNNNMSHDMTKLTSASDKTNKMSVRPAKTQISLGIRPVWSESSMCAQWVAKYPSFLHADSENSDQTGRMLRLIWVFPGRTLILLVLSCRGSYVFQNQSSVRHFNVILWCLFSLLRYKGLN